MQAIKYYKMGAEAGHLESLYEYGKCWIGGTGVEKNTRYGLVLLRTAADLGLIKAMYMLGHVYQGLYGVE